MSWARARLVLSLLGFTGVVLADAGRDLIIQGNQHYAAGRFAEALKCYQQAAAEGAGRSPELLHNQAAALFKLGQIDQARDFWTQLKNLPDAGWEATSRYNLGNCDYAEALRAARENPQQAIQLLDQAGQQYRAALRLNPAMSDARANLELAHLLKQQIQQQLQNQPQTQPSADQCQQNQSTQPPSSQPGQRGQAAQSPESQPASPSSAQSQPANRSQESGQDQGQAGQEDEPRGQPGQTPSETLPAETQPTDREQSQEGSAVEMTQEQVERLLQMIRDAEKARREKLAQLRVAREKPVERDW